MKKVRIAIAALVGIVCFAFTANTEKQAPCDTNLRWFAVGGTSTSNQLTAISQLTPIQTVFGDVTPNEVPTGTRSGIITSTFPSCVETEFYFCALGYADSQLEVRLINGLYYWVPKANETPACVIKKDE
ncbi:hypothetical protein [Pseudoflavitalea rhizosphaerae]|uniref:hypothetical protein n=1 Tax=Pseudoflavitalea rhizosphaerae TaxID=1884793 RepID=UPI000F8E63B9|nr:hypothetical protein [Pseudoflavitalea rhizosphaerae]